MLWSLAEARKPQGDKPQYHVSLQPLISSGSRFLSQRQNMPLWLRGHAKDSTEMIVQIIRLKAGIRVW